LSKAVNKAALTPSPANSPAASARLQSATPDQLDLWTDRVLDAPTLEAVLGGH